MDATIEDRVVVLSPRTGPVVPQASVVVRAFAHPPAVSRGVLGIAADLAAQQWSRARAYQVVSSGQGDVAAVIAAVHTLTTTDAECVRCIDRLDNWAAVELPENRAGLLHTEMFGQLVNRLAGVWATWRLLDEHSARAGRDVGARAAWYQLGELVTAYDDLMSDLAAGRRRLPRYQRSLCSAVSF